METVRVLVGTVVTGNSGQTNDNRVPVEFEAELLGRRTEYGLGRGGGITDTRGTTERLYRSADGRLVVHIDDWSRWVGEPSTETLFVVSESELQPGGRFEALGRVAGFGRALALDEAVSDLPPM